MEYLDSDNLTSGVPRKDLKDPNRTHSPQKMSVGEWAEFNSKKADNFATHLAEVFKPSATVRDNLETEKYLFFSASEVKTD